MKSKWDELKPIDDPTLEGFIRHARDRAEEHFAANALGDRDHSFAKQLHQKIDEEAERLRRANSVMSRMCEESMATLPWIVCRHTLLNAAKTT
jgi:hypothetical protein